MNSEVKKNDFILALGLTSCVTMGKLLRLFKPVLYMSWEVIIAPISWNSFENEMKAVKYSSTLQ